MKTFPNTELSLYSTIGNQNSLKQEPPRTLNDKIIYECYKPRTLNDAKDFTALILKKRQILPNELDDYDQETSRIQPQDFDIEQQLAQIPNPRLKAYFEEYAARAKGNTVLIR